MALKPPMATMATPTLMALRKEATNGYERF
jgi:hypothetical protein